MNTDEENIDQWKDDIEETIDSTLNEIFSDMDKPLERMMKSVRQHNKKKWDRIKPKLSDLKNEMRKVAEEVKKDSLNKL